MVAVILCVSISLEQLDVVLKFMVIFFFPFNDS